MEFKDKKKEEIIKLENINNFLEKITTSSISILEGNENKKMNEILSKNKNYLRKIKKDEFEIAIVGLEKAGKSTFANALMESDVLPSAPERCTFTSTRLIYANKDKAVIEFYNEDEFNNIFKSMLKDIKYPNYENVNFKTLSSQEFKSYFDNLETTVPDLYRAHLGKTDEEVLDILKVKDKLILNGTKKEFLGDEVYSDDFQSYIKGENKGSDTAKPRSLKSIEIQSSKLEKLRTAIIYDVPGFDSPTKIHERQTMERLKIADAIILVTNIGSNPSIQGTSLNIITKTHDDEGIALSDKLFVFGNQIDRVNEEKDISSNTDILRRDVLKYKLAEKKRVYVGSALKYLVINNIKKADEYQDKFKINDGILNVRNEIIKYYKTDRFEILQTKIEHNRIELKKLFEAILKRYYNENFDTNFEQKEIDNIKLNTINNIEKVLKKNLEDLAFKLKEEIMKDKYFSNKFQEKLNASDVIVEISNDEINTIKKEKIASITNDLPIENINHSLRDVLHRKFLNDFSNLIISMTDEKSQEVDTIIRQKVLDSILDNSSTIYKKEIEDETNIFIDNIIKDISHDKGRFLYLIERFARDIFDILIAKPILSEDRINKFKEAKTEFAYLDNYYSNGKGELIEYVLVGKKVSIIEKGFDILKNEIMKSSNISKLKDIIKDLSVTNSDYNFDMDNILKSVKRSTTEDEVLQEINQDIMNLKDILEKAVLKASNLELAFSNSINKQLIRLVDSIERENKEQFNNFISSIIGRLKEKELKSINNRIEELKEKKNFIEELNKINF